MNTELEEYTDEQTGVHLTVKRDIPEHPLFISSGFTKEMSLETFNEAIRRLMDRSGLPPTQQMQQQQPGQQLPGQPAQQNAVPTANPAGNAQGGGN